ncbi:multi-sensor signal transduction histidine kinase [Sphingomonas palmae]|uniref:histidine kinase n=1 Tax=Sphingomonas palmae TaxID=1855283 RepID=A0A1H7HTM1_9SPHN|nr:XrtA/PEP-CTERM system histidine kinase PrsK [Sphingomonas palmae]SEK53498.1 multi-sensor signal transduction histidine kinase [Sphingomonas palmae]
MAVAAFIIWLHGLAALLFVGAALAETRSPVRTIPRWLLLFTLGASALWSLSVAGIGDGESVARVLVIVRNAGWLAVLFALSANVAGESRWRVGVYVSVALCLLLAAALVVAFAAQLRGDARAEVERLWLILRLLATIGALVLLHQHVIARAGRWSEATAVLTAAMAVMWVSDLFVLAVAYAAGTWADWLTTLRGVANVLVATTAIVAVQRPTGRTLSVSRAAAAQMILVAGGVIYVVVATAVTGLLGEIAGAHARKFQAAFVIGTGTALFTFVATPWLRAWLKVMIAKHLFSHRYDYRAEWMRFTDTLGVSGADVPSLPERVVEAIANLTGSPAGLLLYAEGDEMVSGPAWRWEEPPCGGAAALITYLAATARIIDLDSCRQGEAPEDEIGAIPSWLLARDDAWAVVPLLRGTTLIGAVVLAHPPIPRALDWEDFDLLGAAGQQAASFLAEERAHAALADAKRFDEFHRRLAFIMHDLKNLVSQTALVARNAERHADNPAFRADMIATLSDTSQRMTALLARLSQHQAPATDTLETVDLLALARDIAATRAAQYSIEVTGTQVFGHADLRGLRTLLDHLVQNAIEAGAADQAVHLHVDCDASSAAITVIDHGGGMSAAFARDSLFRPFVSTKTGGFGLGAYEARQMAEQMGGSVSVVTREGEGSRFRVGLPLAPTATAPSAPPLAPAWEQAA